MRVPGVCAYPKQLEEVAAPSVAPALRAHVTCTSKRHLTRLTPPIPGLWLCFTHKDCECNQIVSCVNRVLGVTPPSTREGVAGVRRAATRLFAPMGHTTTWTMEEVVRSFRDNRGPRYRKAMDTLRVRQFTDRDARVQAFIKSEKFCPADKINPDPRMIQARGMRYNILLAQYLRPIERKAYRLVGPRGGRLIAKGLNASERADLILRKWHGFSRPVCCSLDASRWDKHVTKDMLKVEHSVYRRFNSDPFFAKLLSLQLVNKCATRGGVRWVAHGKRMSGDMNTALGNCVLMCSMVFAAMEKLGVRFDLLDDGDDCLLFFEANHIGLVSSRLPEVFLTFGQQLKLENVAYAPEEIVFCQSRIVTVSTGPRLVRNWRKVLSHGTAGVKHWNNPIVVPAMLNAVGSCELACNPGVPILQEYALALRRNSLGKRLRGHCDVEGGLRIRASVEVKGDFDECVYDAQPAPITMAARLSFELAWGVSVSEQLAIERLLKCWLIDSFDSVPIPAELASDWVDGSLPDLQIPTAY